MYLEQYLNPDETTGCERCDAIYFAIGDMAKAQELLAAARRRVAFVRGPRSLHARSIDTAIKQLNHLGAWLCADCEHCDGKPLPGPTLIP